MSELGLDDKIIGIPSSHPAAKQRFIYGKGKINKLPSSVSSIMRRMDPFGQALLPIMLKEAFKKPSTEQDESIYDFFKRRFSPEVRLKDMKSYKDIK